MGTKTPVSTLNEYMFRIGEVPHFELVHESTGHDTIFQYIVQIGNVTAKGAGRSKKEAKHNAAQNVLEELAKSDELVREQLQLTSGIKTDSGSDSHQNDGKPSVAVSPYAEQVNENSVGALAELCGQNDLPLPTYELVRDFGPPHAKTFEIRCIVLKLQEIGSSRTKKQAKHISAKRMIDRIKDHLSTASLSVLQNSVQYESPSKTVKDSSHQKAIGVYCTIKDKDRGGGVIENLSINLANSHLNIKELSGSQVDEIREETNIGTPEETLQKFADEQNVDLAFSSLDKHEDKCICTASLSTTPELVQFGICNDMNSARELAAINLLVTLKTMLS